MKKQSLFLSIFFLGLSFGQAQEKGFILKGKIPGMQDGIEISLLSKESERQILAETFVKNGEFELKGQVERPLFCTLITNNLQLVSDKGWPKDSINWTYTPVFIENVEMKVVTTHYKEIPSDWSCTPNFRIVGGEVQNDYSELGFTWYEASGGHVEMKKQVEEKVIWNFILSHPHSVVAVFYADQMLYRGYNLSREQIEQLDKAITDAPADVKRFKQYRERLKYAQHTTVGSELINLELTDANGKVINLVDIVPKGKYVLVDFWASWCGMCLYAMPQVKKLKENYPDKFVVIGVSCDKDLKAWKHTMKKHDMPWAQYVLTKQGYDDFFHKYQVGDGVPYYALIAPDGKVLKSPSHVSDVEEVLKNNLGTRLTVTVENLVNLPVTVCHTFSLATKTDTLMVDKQGLFSGVYSLHEPKEAFLNVQIGKEKHSFLLYMRPKSMLNVTIRKNASGVDVNYSGDTEYESAYRNLEWNMFTLSRTFSTESWLLLEDFNACKQYVAEKQQILKDALLKIDDASFVDQKLKSLEAGKKIHYLNYAVAKQKSGYDMKKDAAFKEFAQNIQLNDTANITLTDNYLNWYVIREYPNTNGMEAEVAKLRVAKKIISNKDVKNKLAKNALGLVALSSMFGADVSTIAPPLYEEILKVSTDKDFCDYLRKELYGMKNQQVGTPVVDLKMSDTQGKAYSLKQIVGGGKYTYIDFWATWCGPCCKEIPFLEKLVTKYKNHTQLRFVSISMDVSREAWLKKLQADKPEWEQYNMSKAEQEQCNAAYNITGIPRFMVFDKEGKILVASAKRPSDKDIETFFDSLR